MTDNSQSQYESWFSRSAKLLYVLLGVSAGFVAWVEKDGAYQVRNLIPFAIVAVLAWYTLNEKGRRRLKHDRRWLFGLIGFSIPAVGLSMYLHWRWQWDIDQTRTMAVRPDLLFRFLPAYSFIAGLIGFWIGWIIGKNLNEDSG